MEQKQLSFIDATLSKDTRRKVERLLSSYRNIDAIIKRMEEDLPETKLTPNYQASESQRTNQFNSTVENIVMVRDKLEQKKVIKNKLDRVYDSLRPVQKTIWEQRYMLGRFR
jgi:cellobiose phosphorylase